MINLNATNCASRIIQALPNKLVIEETVMQELEVGRLRGRIDADITERLVVNGLIEIVRLSKEGLGHFEALIAGSAIDTLDDGEAATIAYALEADAIPLVDERKAHRICRERFPAFQLASTMDLLTHPDVEKSLGVSELAEAVFRSLVDARMRVFTDHIDWVVDLIGSDRASKCVSLPRRVRERFGRR
jgi:predicted nucleic acid-binding protein